MDQQQKGLQLFQFPGCWQLPSLTPECIQIETILRSKGIAHEVNYWRNPEASPSGKFPMLVDGDQIVGYPKIASYLKDKKGIDLDGSLTERQKAEREALTALIENKLYFAMLWNWWMEEENFLNTTKPAFGEALPFPLNRIIPLQMRNSIHTRLKSQDYILNEEVYKMAEDCYQALAVFLGSKPFFFGEIFTSVDALIFGHLACQLYPPMQKSTLRELICKHDSLVRYCGRIFVKYYGKDPTLLAIPPLKSTMLLSSNALMAATGALGFLGVALHLILKKQ